jgi:hypothetical protein
MIRDSRANGRRTAEAPAREVRRNVLNFARDLWELAELQCQLVRHDAREASSRAVLSLGLAGAAIVFALAVVPMLLLAAGWLLINRLEVPHDIAFGIMALVALVVAALLAWTGWRALRNGMATFKRSGEEMGQNLRWIKSSLTKTPAREEAEVPWN